MDSEVSVRRIFLHNIKSLLRLTVGLLALQACQPHASAVPSPTQIPPIPQQDGCPPDLLAEPQRDASCTRSDLFAGPWRLARESHLLGSARVSAPL